MSEHHPEIIIIKKKGGHEEEHHGGAWKIAFADFMTAMMTFFLVLWIINATDKSTKSIIARYFNPVHLENPAKAQKGLHNEAAAGDPEAKDGESTPPAGKAETPAEKGKSAPAPEEKEKKHAAKPEGKPPAQSAEPHDAAHPKPTMSEGALMEDPYSSLDRIAGPAPAAEQSTEKAADKSSPETTTPDNFRNPFDPAGAFAQEPEDAKTAAEVPAQPAPSRQPSPKEKAPEPPAKAAQAAPPSPAASSPAASSPAASSPAPPAAAAAKESKGSAAAKILSELKAKIGAPGGAGPSLDVRATNEGVLISLTDQMNFSMFPVGSAEPQPEVVKAMNAIAQSLIKHSGAIVIRGHTDARPYHSQIYDNWRLSEARAQMAYYMLTRAHLTDKRVEHIEGYADRRLKNAQNPLAAENRRIEILLREGEP